MARRVAAISFDALPGEVVGRAKLLVLDQLGVQLLGARLPHVQAVRQLAARSGGRSEATAVDSSELVSASQAAWVSGTLGHSAAFDDAHLAAWHTSSAVVPAVIALAEREDRTGAELLAAVVAGVQVMGVLGTVAGNRDHRARPARRHPRRSDRLASLRRDHSRRPETGT